MSAFFLTSVCRSFRRVFSAMKMKAPNVRYVMQQRKKELKFYCVIVMANANFTFNIVVERTSTISI